MNRISHQMVLRLLACTLLATLSSASFCGDSAIPYSLEVRPDGQPILGCARPTCFGWAPSGQPATNTGSFYRINGHADGFMRAGRTSIPAFAPSDARLLLPQTAVCDVFFSSSCAGVNQWVGGIAPQLNVSHSPAATIQCCTFDGLLLSEDRGQASLHGGQMVMGGEVVSSGIQVAFDYIADVGRVVGANGSIQYDVSIRRMECAALPESSDDYIKRNNVEGGVAPAQAFQAPNVAVDEPLPLSPAGAEEALSVNAVHEETAQEVAELSPGTQSQPALQPPPSPPQPPIQDVQATQFGPQAPAQYSPSCNQWCFTGDMTVTLMDNSIKRLDMLKKEDWVMAAGMKGLEYVPVEYWLHRVPSQEAEFNEFETEDGKTIKLTDKHYIYKGDCSRVNTGPVAAHSLPREAVFADEIHAGDCLFTVQDDLEMHEVRVVRSGKVRQTGIYAPMTASGRILVNGVYASCHNIMKENTMGLTVFMALNELYDSVFGGSSDNVEIVETPSTLNTILDMAELFIPNHLLALLIESR